MMLHVFTPGKLSDGFIKHGTMYENANALQNIIVVLTSSSFVK